METFHWKVSPGMQVTDEPAVLTVKLGDGYEQRRAAGINSLLKKYSVTVNVRRRHVSALEDFLARHGGWKAFQWREPQTFRTICVVCRKWSTVVNGAYSTVTCEFEHVMR